MMTRYECALNGIALSGVSPAIYVTDIAYNAPKMENTAVSLAGRPGQRIMRRSVQSSSVTISFEIHEQDTARRNAICQQAQEWAAGGGYLTTRDRSEQRLSVICDTPPVIGSALRWTDKIKMVFTAYDFPFWEDEEPQSVTISGSSGSASLYAGGYAAPVYVTAKVVNTSNSALGSLTLTAGDTAMTLKGIALPAEKTLTIDYIDGHILRIATDGVSVLRNRTDGSSDDLRLPAGQRGQVTVSANTSVTAVFSARGLYL